MQRITQSDPAELNGRDTSDTGPPDAGPLANQSDGDVQRPRTTFTMRPALIVLGLALVILVVFSLGSAFSHTAVTPTKAPKGSTAVKGSPLRATSAQAGLSPIEQDGQPPANVLAAITLPVGAVRVSTTNPGQGNTFDQSVEFSVHASEATVLAFYKIELHHFGWRTVTSGPASHQAGQQIVGQIAGEDGFYWQLGVVVSPSTFSANGTVDVTEFDLRVLQVGDYD
jgi:hypothetical protein